MKYKTHVLTLAVMLAFIVNACIFLKPAPPAEKGQNPLPTKPQSEAVVTQVQAVAPLSQPAINNLPQSFNLTQVTGSYQFTEGPAVDSM